MLIKLSKDLEIISNRDFSSSNHFVLDFVIDNTERVFAGNSDKIRGPSPYLQRFKFELVNHHVQFSNTVLLEEKSSGLEK